MGLSYEVADARVRDIRAHIWMLDEVTFTGAAILLKKKAAYENTSIELAAQSDVSSATQASEQCTPCTEKHSF